ncbi:efflux RND transporter periplasmic adaptor subunit [Pedobacter suwonensis]|uniref:efflux RND transporter periplasmic adaptor subunit n=1 Tax=Pedobacter suwonensis TaxID=332999 RepID=UPI00369B5D0D
MKKKMKCIRIILPAILFGTLLIAACSNPKQAPVQAQSKTAIQYTCPMHPQILEDHPGNCPICRMTLVKKSGQASEGSGISLSTVLEPVNSTVISSVAFALPQEKEVATQVSAEGYLDFDTRTFNNIASRYSGRIEKMYIKFAFQKIHPGQRIFDIYSADMVTAQQDLIYITKNSSGETELLRAAKQKLLLLGMTAVQVEQVVRTGKAFYSLPVYSAYEGHVHDAAHSQMAGPVGSDQRPDFSRNMPLAIKEGMYVEKGQTLFNVVDPHRLWAIIKIDRNSLASLQLNQPVKITLPDLPGKTLNGKVDFIEPTLQQGDKTVSARVYLDNMEHQLKVNSLINASIETGKSKGLWIPRSALQDLGQTKIIWLKKGSSYYAHSVNVGTFNGNEIQITRGLSATDTLAVDAGYLTDSESFIKTKGHE